MIISHRHRFIFIKTEKTAGSTVEFYLRQFCGPDDIVTPLGATEEALARATGISGPNNCGRRMVAPWRLRRKDLLWMKENRKYRSYNRFYNHLPARLIKERIGDDMWNSYTKVTIVRDPWEKTISLYHWRNREPKRPLRPLDEAIEEVVNNWQIYTIDDQAQVDYFIRYENLQTDLEALRDRLGLGGDINLVRLKSGIRPTHSLPHEVFTNEQALRIAELAHNEIEMFGYRWSGPDPLRE
jgi:hypothetical protein